MAKNYWALGCRVCEAANETSSSFGKFQVRSTMSGNFGKHANTDQHQKALKLLGLVPNQSRGKAEAPSQQDFQLVLEHRRGVTSLSLPLAAVGARYKLQKMQWCLGEAGRDLTRAALREVESLAVAQDARKNKLLVRFSSCDSRLQHHKGHLGHDYIKDGQYAYNIKATFDRVLERFCTIGAGGPGPTQIDTELLDRLKDRLECVCADAASNEYAAGRLARSDGYPNLLTVMKDKTHASVRVLKRPWAADPHLSKVMDMVVLESSSITQRIDHSDTFSDVFARFCASRTDGPVDGSRVKNMRGQKNRFASYSKPLGRACLFLNALIDTAAWIMVQRRGKPEAVDAGNFCAFLSEENAVLMAMMADACDSCVALTRSLDTENYDAATLNWEISTFVQSLNFLFVEGGVVEHGYTKEMLKLLRSQQAFMDLHDRPRCLGGPGKVTLELLQGCIERMQVFVSLACQTLRSEFPDYDLTCSFSIFDLQSKTMQSSESFADRANCLPRLAQILQAKFAKVFACNSARTPEPSTLNIQGGFGV